MRITKAKIISHSYRDSVVLMELSREVLKQPGVIQAAVMMGTTANLAALEDAGLMLPALKGVAADDLLIVVETESDDAADQALETAHSLLEQGTASTGRRTIVAADGAEPGAPRIPELVIWRQAPEQARLAVISVPGEYAAAEAWKALKAGRHVLLFSNHVSLEDERALKQAGRERGLLVMGAECGTAILGGVPLAFANEVRRGSIGLAAASGSGLQEVTCLIDRLGAGISQAIGTGGRDLSKEVGGLGMQAGIDLLLADKETTVLALLSKPPSRTVAESILARVKDAGKPVVVCFLGAKATEYDLQGVHFAETLEELAFKAVELSGEKGQPVPPVPPGAVKPDWQERNPLLRGLFAGGTLAYEAMLVLQEGLGPIHSNAPLHPDYNSGKDLTPDRHICLDLGAEEYTVSVPHPMIDGRWRADLLTEVAADERVGVILFDLLLGLGSDDDPAGAIAAAIETAGERAQRQGRALYFVASITGTLQDPQNWDEQQRKLQNAGVLLAPSNAAAARLAASLLMK